MGFAIGSRQREIGSRVARLQLERRFIRVMHREIYCSDRDRSRCGRQSPQLREQIQARPPLEYAILMNGMQHMWVSCFRFFFDLNRSPISRIAVTAAALALATSACDKAGSGSSPIAPAPVTGSTINYTAVGA